MGTAASSNSSPEPDEAASLCDRVLSLISEKPMKMAHMLKATKLMNDASVEEKSMLFDVGVVQILGDLIAECGSVHTSSGRQGSGDRRSRRSRRSSAGPPSQRGVGYGHGSTRSRWDMERTVEERLQKEENLTWLLNALTAFIHSSPPEFPIIKSAAEQSHLTVSAAKEIGESAVVVLLEYHLKNDSVFDVSEHMELYQALLEMAGAMTMVPELVGVLVRPYQAGAKSVAKELIPKFKETMSAYHSTWSSQTGSPDFRMIDFINKVDLYSKMILVAAREWEREAPAEERIRTAMVRPRPNSSQTWMNDHLLDDFREDMNPQLYVNALKPLQMTTYRFIGDYGKLVLPFTFKKEIRNTNPFSPSLRERTKRIAKELASMPNALPLNASNSIFVCVDEGRCDLLKVLISGPDDTPYANGLFEFDIFFPTSYPFAPPKCAFLTTGAGNVRFNPNLYNDGKICLSILGTWEGRPEEKWTPYCSLMQVLVSIQGLIFVKDPYFNEPGFEKYQGTEKGDEYSRKYNLQIEHATLNYAIREQLRDPPPYFKHVIERHLWLKRTAIMEQARRWLADAKKEASEVPKRKDSDMIASPYHQERTIQQLITELASLTCPDSGV